MWNEIPPTIFTVDRKERASLIAVPAAALLDVVCLIGASILRPKKKNLKIQHNNGILRKDWLLYFLVFQFARPLPLSVTAPCSKQHIPFLREIYFFYFPPQKKPAFRFIVFDFCLSTPFISS